MIPVFLGALKDKPRVSNQICRALENLANSIGFITYESSNHLSPYFEDLFKALMENAYR